MNGLRLTLTTELTQFGKPRVLGAQVGGTQNVLALLGLNGKDKLLVSDAGIGSDADELGEIDGAFLLLHGLVVVVREVERVVIILQQSKRGGGK